MTVLIYNVINNMISVHYTPYVILYKEPMSCVVGIYLMQGVYVLYVRRLLHMMSYNNIFYFRSLRFKSYFATSLTNKCRSTYF